MLWERLEEEFAGRAVILAREKYEESSSTEDLPLAVDAEECWCVGEWAHAFQGWSQGLRKGKFCPQ